MEPSHLASFFNGTKKETKDLHSFFCVDVDDPSSGPYAWPTEPGAPHTHREQSGRAPGAGSNPPH